MVDAAIEIVLVLGILGIALAALLEVLDRQRIAQRAETIRRFTPEPLLLLAPPAAVAIAAGTMTPAEEREPVGRERDQWLALGLDELDALHAAAEVDVEAFRELVGRGCPPQLALEILR